MKWPNVAEYLKIKARQFGDDQFMIDYGEEGSYTYNEFDTVTDRLAASLRKIGVKSGDRVAFLHPNHSDLILGYFAAIKAGGIAVIVNPNYTPREMIHIVKDSGARILITTERFKNNIDLIKKECPSLVKIILKKIDQRLEEAIYVLAGPCTAEDPVETSADDVAMIFYTSGTTGKPKGVMISHRNITFGASNTAQNYGLSTSDITIVCLPLNHIFANASPLWGSISSGGTVVVMERFQTEHVFEAIKRYCVTWFPGVPTMFNYLLCSFDKARRDVSSLRMGLSGGASLSMETLKNFEAKFRATILEAYGLTESTGLVTVNPVYGVRKPGSIGISASGVAVRLVDEHRKDVPKGAVGELIFKGPNGTIGYWGLPEETNKKIHDGWISTGDLAYQDDEGYFYIAGRKSELIISGGYNIFPREIEEVLNSHPDVYESAVIGIPDPALGEALKAFVAPTPGKTVDAKDLETFCRENLAKYKVPRMFVMMDELPKNTTGKILKNKLK